MDVRRSVLILAAVGFLGGCEVGRVRSYEPLFTSSDAASVPFRGGVWAAPEPDCDFDSKSSLKTWPSCAHGVHARGDEFHRRVVVDGMTVETLLAAGDPLILQTHMMFAAEEPRPEYEYAAVLPLKRDETGRVVAYEMWSVLCRPPETVRDGVSPAPELIPAPPMPPGIVATDDGCIARDPASVRGAAAMTRRLGWKAPWRTSWIRPFKLRDNFGAPPDEETAPPPP